MGKGVRHKTRDQLLDEIVRLVDRSTALQGYPDAFAWNARKCAEALLALRILELGKQLPTTATCEALMQVAELSRGERIAFGALQQAGNIGAHLQPDPTTDCLHQQVSLIAQSLASAVSLVIPDPPSSIHVALGGLQTRESTQPARTLDAIEVQRALRSSRRAARSPVPAVLGAFVVGVAATVGAWSIMRPRPNADVPTVVAKSPTSASPSSPASQPAALSASTSATPASPMPATNMRVVAAGKGFCVDTPPFTARSVDSADRQEILSGSVLLRLYTCSHDKWQEHADSHKQFHKDSTSFSIRGVEAGRVFVERCRVGMPGPHVCMRVLFKSGDEARAEPLLLAPSACP